MSPSPKRVVLLVDDDRDLHTLVRSRLRRLKIDDLELRTANDGAEALALLPDLRGTLGLILSDVNMPRVDGHALLRRARDTGYAGPFVLIGALAHKEHDADDWVEKDRLLDCLPDLLTQWLS